MLKKEIDIIGASLGWGAGRYETAFGPKVLQEKGLQEVLEQRVSVSWHEIEEPEKKDRLKKTLAYADKLALITQFNHELAHAVQNSIKKDHFPLVLGGDHSIAIGTWSGLVNALNAAQEFGLIWFDAHMDSHTPQTTPSGNIHGMPLAVLLGHGAPELVKLVNEKVKLNPLHVVLIGVRSFEKEEAALLADLNVKIYFIEEVKQRGLAVIFEEALKRVTTRTKGFGISLDIDVFDPKIAMGTGTPEANGLNEEEVCSALKMAVGNSLYKGLEIAEFNPTRDVSEQTLKLMEKVVLSAIGNIPPSAKGKGKEHDDY